VFEDGQYVYVRRAVGEDQPGEPVRIAYYSAHFDSGKISLPIIRSVEFVATKKCRLWFGVVICAVLAIGGHAAAPQSTGQDTGPRAPFDSTIEPQRMSTARTRGQRDTLN